MPNLLQRAATWHGGQMKGIAGHAVAVQQGTTRISSLTGWREQHEHTVIDSEGFGTQVRSWDWRFVAADLPSGFEFRAGAEITEGVDKYEVIPIGPKPCVEPADSSGIQVIVHTKKVA